MIYSGASDIGLVRRENEDSWIALPEQNLFVVADGIGGQNAGEIASQTATLDLLEQFNEIASFDSLERVKDYCKKAIEKTNRLVYEKSLDDPSLRGMGTTTCMLYLWETHVVYAHVGDSRIYRFRKEEGLIQLTEDHTLVTDLIHQGALHPFDARNSKLRHVLTRAVGLGADVQVDVGSDSFREGDLYLLCSDGLTNAIADHQIEQKFIDFPLSSQEAIESAVVSLIESANRAGGPDNITVILTQCVGSR